MSRKSLIARADKLFSLAIRNRGAVYGMNHCFTCGVQLEVRDLQCGHFRPRRYLSTRWHEVNCWPQCNRCNVGLGGNLDVYERKLRSHYGDDAVDGLYLLSRMGIKTTDDDIRGIIDKYT